MSWLCRAWISSGPGGLQRQHDRDEFGARDDGGQQLADVGDEEVQRHAERIFDQRPDGVQALGPRRRRHIASAARRAGWRAGADHAAGAGRADDDDRDPEWLRIEATLAQLIGWSKYFGSIRPPIDRPNQTLAKYSNTSASRKCGMARPSRPERRQAVVAPAVLVRRRIDADREGDEPGEQDRGEATAAWSATAGRRRPGCTGI